MARHDTAGAVTIRLLLIGRADSAHAQRWLGLCEEIGVAAHLHEPEGPRDLLRGVGSDDPEGGGHSLSRARADMLARLNGTVETVRPDIVQVMGLDPFAFLVFDALDVSDLRPRRVIQVRGGPDLRLALQSQPLRARVMACLAQCDAVLADHAANLRLCATLGLPPAAQSRCIGPVPGGGGLTEGERALFNAGTTEPPVILWPKAYVTASVDGFAIAEALRRLYQGGRAFRLRMLFAVQEDFNLWLRGFWPAGLLERTTCLPRLDHAQALSEIARADILVAPSLMDGIPNVLLEALTLGTLPVISDLGTGALALAPWIAAADNLDPAALSGQLDDLLALGAAMRRRRVQENRDAILGYAAREGIATRVRDLYCGLARPV